MSKWSIAIAFVAGVAAGSLTTWKITNIALKELNRRTEEEIASMKEKYNKQRESSYHQNYVHDEEEIEYRNIVNDQGYSTETEPINAPYVITPEEAGEDGYDLSSCTFYKDGVITDENGKVMDVEEIKDLIGLDSLNHFGDYEPDAVHVRNEENKIDFEVLRVEVNYSDIFPKRTAGVGSE